MTKPVALLFALVAVLMSAVGVLVGQQMQWSKFVKYLQSVSVSSMQIGILEAIRKLFGIQFRPRMESEFQ